VKKKTQRKIIRAALESIPAESPAVNELLAADEIIILDEARFERHNVDRVLIRNEDKNKPSRPPLNAEFLFYLFLNQSNCDALVGDLEERYKLIRKKFGARRANFWYWVQVLTSVGPIIWAATKRLLRAVSGVAALVEVWRRIRG
jgi:hypothetical protein